MSELVVQVTTIDDLRSHPNADALEIATVKGWQVVVVKDKWQVGRRAVYFPPDTVLPQEVSDRFGVTKYLSKGRIRCTKLRGEPSFGLVVEPDENWPVGADVAVHYGATKYEPPAPASPDALPDHPLFPEYTEIENLRNYPDVLIDGESVVLTEKVDGTNARIGLIEGEIMAGSRELRRKEPQDYASSHYWFPLTVPGVRDLLESQREHRQVVLFGEVFGSKIQHVNYGLKDTIAFRAFDLMIDGRYLDYEPFTEVMVQFAIPTMPVVAMGEYSLDFVRRHAGGKSLLAEHGREGVVVRPLKERTDPTVGRVILKYIGDEWLLGNHGDVKDR